MGGPGERGGSPGLPPPKVPAGPRADRPRGLRQRREHRRERGAFPGAAGGRGRRGLRLGPSAPNFGEVQVPPPAVPLPPRSLSRDAKKPPKINPKRRVRLRGGRENDLGGKWQNGPEGGTGCAELGMAGPAAPGSFPSWKCNPHSWLRFLTPVGISIFLCVFFPPPSVFFSFGGESFRFCRISLFMILRNQKLLVSWKREEFCSGNAQVVGTLGIAPTLLVGDTF